MSVLSGLSILSKSEIEKIHDASLSTLAQTGVRIPHKDVLALFADAGARVDFQNTLVKIPAKLVEDCMAKCGKQFILAGRDRDITARFGYGTRNYNSIFGEPMWIDHRTGKRRFPSLEDVRLAARVADALPYINVVGAMADPHEIPVSYRCVLVFAELIKNTTKPVGHWFHDRSTSKYLVELFQTVAGGFREVKETPIAFPFLEPISPLSFTFNGVDLLFETCKIPLPVPVGPMAQVGATGPGTLSGTVHQENAEILAGICVTQLIREGTPVCYGGIPHAFDMKTMQLIFSGPEQALMAVAMTQMAKYYELSVYINVGLTDSKIPDAQGGLEAGLSLLSGVLAGADIFGHMGICGVDQAASLSVLLMQHEIISYIERIMRGFEVNEETTASEVIRSVGPGGNYLAHEHTLRHFREELWFPTLLDRNFYEQWDASGRSRMEDRIQQQLETIIDNHQAEPVSPEVEREIERITAAAQKELG